jgi:ferrochelatase
MKITREQARALEDRLHVPVRAAARLWSPHPEEVLRPLLNEGVERILSLPLAPQSVHIYHDFVEDCLSGNDVQVVRAPSYGLEPKLVAAFVNAIVEARGRLAENARFATLLTAHSLPLRAIQAGDPYQSDFEAMAGAVRAALVDVGFTEADVHIAYQSQGMGGGEWLGPDLETTLERVCATSKDALLVAPIGFVAEHVETLYDIDVEFAALARRRGVADVVRMPAMNTRSDFIEALEAVARPLL